MRRSVSAVLSAILACSALSEAVYAEPPPEPFSVLSFPEQLGGQRRVADVGPKPESREYLGTRADTLERLLLRQALDVVVDTLPPRPMPLWARF
jgi:hypothetical protein